MNKLNSKKSLTRFRSKHTKHLAELSRRIHFNNVEMECLVELYYKMIKHAGTTCMTRSQFYSMLSGVLEMHDSSLYHRMSYALDKSNPNVTLESFIAALSLFARGTFQERIDYCFRVYDVVGDGFIKRDNLMFLVRHGVYKHLKEEVQEAVKDYADRLMKKVDLDRDGMISFNDYSETVKKHPGLLEMMGICLPDPSAVYTFLFTFTSNLNKQ